jgi:hypothetical protein
MEFFTDIIFSLRNVAVRVAEQGWDDISGEVMCDAIRAVAGIETGITETELSQLTDALDALFRTKFRLVPETDGVTNGRFVLTPWVSVRSM